VFGAAIACLSRCGLLSVVVGLSVALSLVRAPLTPEWRAWYVESAIVALLLVLVLAGWATHAALRSPQPRAALHWK
jgi:hypothetical protein